MIKMVGNDVVYMHKMLDVSTGHITKETSEWLSAQARTKNSVDLIVYEKGGNGFFVLVLNVEASAIPPDMASILNLASRCECDWIMLDSDGNVIKALDYFEW